MGMSDKEFMIMIGIIIGIILYGYVVLYIMKNYGDVWGIIAFIIPDICFFLYASRMYNKYKEVKNE